MRRRTDTASVSQAIYFSFSLRDHVSTQASDARRAKSHGLEDGCSIVIFRGVVVTVFVFVAVIIIIVLAAFLLGLAGASGSLLFLALLALDSLDLLLVHGGHVLLGHQLKLQLLLSALLFLLALELAGALNLGTAGADLSVGGRLRPLARGVRLCLARRNRELNKGREPSHQPLFDELGQYHAQLARRRVHLLAKLIGQGENDLFEFEENDFDALQVDDVL
mmetsp:Transcript_24406/g.28681  ORF Transcript_24406/g.28681 Transcript_24406/m.28681 type:complete len:221 (-) Transcript_24406:2179-2841(-)